MQMSVTISVSFNFSASNLFRLRARSAKQPTTEIQFHESSPKRLPKKQLRVCIFQMLTLLPRMRFGLSDEMGGT